MLSLNHKMFAEEAHKFGYVAKVYRDPQEIWDILKQITELPIGSIIGNKKLMRRFTIKELEQACLYEAEELSKRLESEEALEAVIRFRESRKPKSKL